MNRAGFIALLLVCMATTVCGQARFSFEKLQHTGLPHLHVPELHVQHEKFHVIDAAPGLLYSHADGALSRRRLPEGRFVAFSLASDRLLLLEPGIRILSLSLERERHEVLIDRQAASDDMPYAISFSHDEWLFVLNRDTGKTWAFNPEFIPRYQFRLPVSGRNVRLQAATEGTGLFDPERGRITLYSHDGIRKRELSGPGRIEVAAVGPRGEIVAAAAGFAGRWNAAGDMMPGYPQNVAMVEPVGVAIDGSSTLLIDRKGPVLVRISPGAAPVYRDLSALLDSADFIACPGRGLVILVDRRAETAVAIDSGGGLIRRYSLDYHDNDGIFILRDGMGNNFIGQNGGAAPLLMRGRLAEPDVRSRFIGSADRLSGLAFRLDETVSYVSSMLGLIIETADNSLSRGPFFESASRSGGGGQPVAIQYMPGGNVAVLDRYNRQLKVYGRDGRISWQAGAVQDDSLLSGRSKGGVDGAAPMGSGALNFIDPVALALNMYGHLFVLDSGAGMVQVFNRHGNILRSMRIPRGSHGFSVSRHGYMWLYSESGDVLYLFDDNGKPLGRFGSNRFGGNIVDVSAQGSEIGLLVRSSNNSFSFKRFRIVDRLARAGYLYDRGMYADALSHIEQAGEISSVEHMQLAARIYRALGYGEKARRITETIETDNQEK